MFYKVNNKNEIIETCSINYDDKFLETDKNIVVGFDNKLYFEDYTKTKEYLAKEQEYNTQINNEKLIIEYKQELEELRKDIVQDISGLVVEGLEDKKARYRYLLNEVRVLMGKEPRAIKE